MTRTEVAALICWALLGAGLFWRCLTLGSDPDLIGLFVAWLGGVASVGVVLAIRSAYRRARPAPAGGGEVPPPPTV